MGWLGTSEMARGLEVKGGGVCELWFRGGKFGVGPRVHQEIWCGSSEFLTTLTILIANQHASVSNHQAQPTQILPSTRAQPQAQRLSQMLSRARLAASIPGPSGIPTVAGITAYSPLKLHGAGPGKRVGIIGLGGLGHFGVLWAKALKADKVVVVSRSSAKKADALKMGADDFIATAEDPSWARKHASTLDIIVCTVSSSDMPLMKYLSLLRFDGTFVQVGAPEDGLPTIQQFPLMFKRLKITASLIGPPSEIREMLQLAADKKVKPWIQEIPMKDANKAIVEMEAGKSRYRYVLCNEKQAGGSQVRAGL